LKEETENGIYFADIIETDQSNLVLRVYNTLLVNGVIFHVGFAFEQKLNGRKEFKIGCFNNQWIVENYFLYSIVFEHPNDIEECREGTNTTGITTV
jgi:hypothetical protein